MFRTQCGQRCTPNWRLDGKTVSASALLTCWSSFVFSARTMKMDGIRGRHHRRTGPLNQVAPPGTAELQAAAKYEVTAWEAIWQGEWDRALEALREAIDALSGGRVRSVMPH